MTTKQYISIRDEEHLKFIRKQRCLWCGKYRPNEAHHIRIDTNGGTALKPSDCYTVPLCFWCHKRLHKKGERTFWAKTGISDPVEFSLKIYNKRKKLFTDK